MINVYSQNITNNLDIKVKTILSIALITLLQSQTQEIKQKESRMSKNFIRQNIQNIKGSHKPPSTMQDQFKSRLSVPKPKKYQNVQSHYKQPSLNTRVMEMQKKINDIQRDRTQSMLVSQITQIKDDLRLIKSHLFQLKRSSGVWNEGRQRTRTQSSRGDEEQNIYLSVNNNNRMKSQGSEQSLKHSPSKMTNFKNEQQTIKNLNFDEWMSQYEKRRSNTKKGLSIKAIYSVLKQYKLEGPEYGNIFYGYSKRNSQPVAIKFVPVTSQANQIIEVYDRLWKNIAKAKWPCVNRLYDYKLQENNFIIMERNRSGIANLPYKLILIDIFKSLEFIHECGYLYRNIEPQHFMLNQEGQLTLIDFSRAKRYVDVKGHLLEVTDNVFNGSAFASNSQVKGGLEGRKDDLESLGYFALLLMEYDIPWNGLNKENTIKIRSTITLQELFRGNHKWIEFMATVMRTGRNERPDYRRLQDILQSL